MRISEYDRKHARREEARHNNYLAPSTQVTRFDAKDGYPGIRLLESEIVELRTPQPDPATRGNFDDSGKKHGALSYLAEPIMGNKSKRLSRAIRCKGIRDGLGRED